MTASNVSRFENVWRWFLDVEPSERKHTPRNKIAQIHLDGGDDYLDCEAYWQDDRPSCNDGSDTIDNPGSINPWFDSYADTAAYVESTRREWICLLNCALQNTGNAIGQLAQFNADGTRRPHAAKSRVRTIMLDNRVYRVAM